MKVHVCGSADGNYEIRLTNTKARVTFDGELQWRPPAIWAYSCIINVVPHVLCSALLAHAYL